MGNPELVLEDLPETAMCTDIENQNGVLLGGNCRVGDFEFTMVVMSGITSDTEMQDLTVNKVHRNVDSGGEIEVLQDLLFLELEATDNANSGILKNGYVLSVEGDAASQI